MRVALPNARFAMAGVSARGILGDQRIHLLREMLLNFIGKIVKNSTPGKALFELLHDALRLGPQEYSAVLQNRSA
jgi:hypothetical protein